MVKEKVEGETKVDRFKRIAEARTQRILNDLRLLGNCSNKSVYGYNEEHLKKIFAAIEGEIRRVKSLFSNDKNKKFSLE